MPENAKYVICWIFHNEYINTRPIIILIKNTKINALENSTGEAEGPSKIGEVVPFKALFRLFQLRHWHETRVNLQLCAVRLKRS